MGSVGPSDLLLCLVKGSKEREICPLISAHHKQTAALSNSWKRWWLVQRKHCTVTVPGELLFYKWFIFIKHYKFSAKLDQNIQIAGTTCLPLLLVTSVSSFIPLSCVPSHLCRSREENELEMNCHITSFAFDPTSHETRRPEAKKCVTHAQHSKLHKQQRILCQFLLCSQVPWEWHRRAQFDACACSGCC